ncbi:MAG: type IV secretion system DNA-binding domain-containing protein [Patescibacteria group bacterium]|nr:type IV secretion system DNA-binding domain-containing protein [Patescibacteria group bacterium]MDE1940566.1 type IV secretion system DNA-binding domain-containing protein [Patescibacteria group bacterium]MDE1966904.1 type IV secretion system DNA-binding domain-containing protein [Patescibacteria group bacterium]
MDENRITYFAETDARNKRVKFGIKAKDRTRHVYVIGKTGMGKSTMLENMAVQDIQNGEGMAFIDPHGKTADLLLEYVPKERIRDVIYIAPFDVDYPISFNVLEAVDRDKRHLVSSGLMSTFKKIWEDAWSARMEYILTNTLLALLEYPGATLLGVNRMLSDKEYRKDVVSKITDPSVKAFWVKEFANYTERMAQEAVPAIQNKVGQFTANPLIRNMIGQPVSSFDFRKAMDDRKIIIINLSKGKIGDENMKLLGGLLVTKIYLAAMSRADVPDRVMKVLPNFYLFVDEFQNFANASFADILSEARKYKLNLTIAHQYIEQMDEIVRPAVFGNVGTMITFRIGANDAEALEKEFAPTFTMEDLVNLGFTQIYLKLMIDGLSSAPFSATTLPPIPHPDSSYVKDIIAASREQFSRPRAQVEEEIVKFHEASPARPAPAKGAPGAARSSTAPSASAAIPGAAISGSAPAPAHASAPVPAPVSASVPVPQPPHRAARSASQSSRPASKDVPTKPSETHKPFLGLKDMLHQLQSKKPPEPEQPLAAAKPGLADAPGPATVAAKPEPATPGPADAETPKAVSLSSLTPKAAQSRTDSKARTPENLSQLRNALASLIKPQEKSAPQPAANDVQQPADKDAPRKDPESAASGEAAGGKGSSKDAPREVPEDILKRVLKVD